MVINPMANRNSNLQSTLHSSDKYLESSTGNINSCIEELAHWLPAQGPIREFIHHNTLHAYQDRSFFDGVRIASQMYGAKTGLSFSEYRNLYRQGKISEWALKSVLSQTSQNREFNEALWSALFNSMDESDPPKSLSESGIRGRWRDLYQVNLTEQTHPILFRLVSQYLDQGITAWRMPHSKEGFLGSLKKIIHESLIPFYPLNSKNIRKLLLMEPDDIIRSVLLEFTGHPKHFLRYLTEMALDHPGWSGMVYTLQENQHTLIQRRSITLKEFLAVELLLEYAFATERFQGAVPTLVSADEEPLPIPAQETPREASYNEKLREIWQEAFEKTYVDEILLRIENNIQKKKITQAQSALQSDVVAFFCIDDRECSIRRHLEELNPRITTFGIAGFFGVDSYYQGASDAFPFKHCPVPVQPKHLILERPSTNRSNARKSPKNTLRKLLSNLIHPNQAGENHLVRGFLISQTLGIWAGIKLFFDILIPNLDPPKASSLRRVVPEFDLKIECDEDPTQSPDRREDLQIGYTLEEMANRVEGVLKSTGAILQKLPSLVFFIGHGASSVNNPYFSAYDCGACSGKAGAPNARAIAKMANHPEVRKILQSRGINIPEKTLFIGGLHDTTRDEMQFFDTSQLTSLHQDTYKGFNHTLSKALERNAKERTALFALVNPSISAKEAHEEVKRRSVAIFEPRPELNHATNASCIVGRRDLTRDLNLNRRSFLNSYDPSLDPDGTILAQILGAVVPVCGGINLEYFFSRIDPKKYGAGSKLPHNVAGLLGVTNGIDSDLLTGLPTQMTEVHDPLRIAIVVEQTPEIALKSIQKNAAIYEWVENEWVKYYAISPIDGRSYSFKDGRLNRMDILNGSSGRIQSLHDFVKVGKSHGSSH